MNLSATDKKIVAALSGDIPESLAPFSRVAADLGVSEEVLFARIEQLRRSGALRRFGAAVDHRKVGFLANAMIVWRVPDEKVEEAASVIASCPAVSHCYQREPHPSWPYNLYAMIHGRTREECESEAANVSRRIGSEEYRVLFSVREFKKTSPAYFSSLSKHDPEQ